MVTDDQKDKVLALYHQGEIIEAKKLSETLIQTNPNDAFSWKSLGYCLFKTGDYEDSIGALEASLELENEGDPTLFGTLARAYFSCGDYRRAAENQKKGLLIDPENSYWQFNMAEMLYKSGRGDEAMPYLERAEELGYAPENIMALKSSIFTLSFRFDEGLKEMEKLAEISPDDPAVHNNLGNLSTDLNDFKKASYHYSRAKELSPGSLLPYANEILSLHYDPSQTASSIRKKISEFSHLFPIEKMESLENEISKARSIKVGIISSHLKIHPVGWMLASTLEKLKNDIEIYVYSDSDSQDFLNSRIRNTVKNWNLTYHLDDKNLAKKITKDKIDILFDLAGYSGGTRILTFMHHPSPVIVKWIGGQISSMGIDAYDYFISDPIETPKGQDFEYTEKLIRLPNDYICYTPPEYAPEVTALPAMSNGHITFGCFNNPAKINNITLSQWADILKYIPGSNLLLKGAAYKTERAKERIWNVFTNSGIEKSRIILEGPESHRELLESYQRIDIALDPWPYSGGLTTCEALLMGVPVVTLPGPTFAGRHSATHLTNAGMPELVVNSWEEYRQRVIELASDLPSLAVIRASLRQVFINSPVCDAPRFARHFHKALRAIWQRHCEGKPPAALTFNKRGQAWFEDESTPVKIQSDSNTNGEFEWDFEGKIIAIDNGGQLLGNSAVREMLDDDYLELICFDPTTRAADNSLKSHTNVHYYPGVTLGNGQPVSIYRCSDSTLDGSLKPLIESQQAEVGEGQHPQQLEEHAIETISLDQIEGLPSIDWLVLDAVNDGATILKNGSKTLQDTLLVQARVAFQPTHENQLSFADLQQWMARHGFRFYRFNNEQYRSYFPEDVPEEMRQATELESADALFLPSTKRINTLSEIKSTRLAFLLHTIYNITDITFKILNSRSEKIAKKYLEKKTLTPKLENKSAVSKNALHPSRLKGKNLHVMILDKFTAPFIDFVNENIKESRNHYIVISEERFIYELEPRHEVEFCTKREDFERLESYMENAEKIIFHGLWVEKTYSILTKKTGLYEKTYWFMWGGDFYYPEKQSKIKKEVIEKIGYLVSSIEGDVQYVRDNYHARGKHLLGTCYPAWVKNGKISKKKSKKVKKILLGNSSFETNNHLEAINKLSKLNLSEVSVYCPLSYGSKYYGNKISEYGKKLLGNNFHPIFNFIAPEEYESFLDEIDIAIFNHTRQQAYTTTLALLDRGAKIYFNPKSPVYRKLKSLGVHVFSISQISLEPLKYEDMLKNQKIINKNASNKEVDRFLRSWMMNRESY